MRGENIIVDAKRRIPLSEVEGGLIILSARARSASASHRFAWPTPASRFPALLTGRTSWSRDAQGHAAIHGRGNEGIPLRTRGDGRSRDRDGRFSCGVVGARCAVRRRQSVAVVTKPLQPLTAHAHLFSMC